MILQILIYKAEVIIQKKKKMRILILAINSDFAKVSETHLTGVINVPTTPFFGTLFPLILFSFVPSIFNILDFFLKKSEKSQQIN
jgi:hypothetical protein